MAIQTFKEAVKYDNAPFMVSVNGGGDYVGFFAGIRIDRKTLPDGWYAYDIRGGDSNDDPCEIKNGYIMVNHFGTFCTQDKLPIAEGESLCEGDFDYSFL